MEGDIFIAVILTINVTISLVGVLGNGVIITAFITKRRLRTQSNYFMISLLILSFIHCAVFYPIQALVDIGIIVGQAACLPIGCVGITESVAITMCLLATSTERYIAICWPLTADSILTPNRIVVTFVVIAAYSITSGIIFPSLTWIGYEGGAFEDKYSRCTLVSISPTVGFSVWMCVNWLAPIPIMLMIYCRIFMIVRRHAREINALKPQFNLTATNMVQLHEIPRGRNKIHPNGHVEKTADVNDPRNTGDQITVVNGENLRKHSPILENHMREPQILQNGNGSHDPRTGSGENLQQMEHEVTGQNLDLGNVHHNSTRALSEFDTSQCTDHDNDGTQGKDHKLISSEESNAIRNNTENRNHYDCVSMATRAQIRTTTTTAGDRTHAGTVAGENLPYSVQRKQRNKIFNREIKSAIVIFAIVVLYSFSFIPYVVYIFTNVISGTPDFKQFAIIHSMLFANYALNPYIYGFGNRNIRRAVMHMVCCRLQRDRRAAGLPSVSETL